MAIQSKRGFTTAIARQSRMLKYIMKEDNAYNDAKYMYKDEYLKQKKERRSAEGSWSLHKELRIKPTQ